MRAGRTSGTQDNAFHLLQAFHRDDAAVFQVGLAKDAAEYAARAPRSDAAVIDRAQRLEHVGKPHRLWRR